MLSDPDMQVSTLSSLYFSLSGDMIEPLCSLLGKTQQ